jgi:hypothetical protein
MHLTVFSGISTAVRDFAAAFWRVSHPQSYVPAMDTEQIVLFGVAGLLLVIRIIKRIREGGGEPPKTYEEPTLQLDEAEKPQEVFGELKSTLDADHDAEDRYLRRQVRDDARVSKRIPVSQKIVGAVAFLIAFGGLPYLFPSLSWLRLLPEEQEANADFKPESLGGVMPSASVGTDSLPGETTDQQARAKELNAAMDSHSPIAKKKVKVPPAVKEEKPKYPIDDFSGKALEKFFNKLMRVENKEEGAVARILYYGDSIVASDFVSGMLRRKLQDRFGDAGHGYAIIANAWKGFFHIDVSRTASGEWQRSTCVGPYAEDGMYGLGCATFLTPHEGIWSKFATADLEKWGRNVSRFELEYLKQPGGGSLRLIVDGEEREVIETGGDKEVAWHTVKVEDGPHSLKVESGGDGEVRVFGIRMERDVPGVTLSALGITGAQVRFLDKQDDAHWAKVLERAKPDLVCLAFGSNEIADGYNYEKEENQEHLKVVMKQLEKALPESSFMLVGPPDMAHRSAAQGHSHPYVRRTVAGQKKVAEEMGWAFWNQYKVMGGAGSMWAWVQSNLGNADLVHPTGNGGAVLGRWQYHALMDLYEKHKAALRE